MSNQIVCDVCGKTTDLAGLFDSFTPWWTLTCEPIGPYHLCSNECLTAKVVAMNERARKAKAAA